MTIERELNVNLDKQEFYNTLNDIHSHMFTTDDTLEFRSDAQKWVDEVRQELSQAGATTAIFIPVGSVATGMVLKEAGSDIEGAIIYDCPTEAIDKVKCAIQKTSDLPDNFEGFISFFHADTCIANANEWFENALATESPYPIESIALLFAPSLLEQTDLAERSTMDKWRKRILEKLAKISTPQNRDLIWHHMTQSLERQFVRYEESIGGNPRKRIQRVEQVISKKIEERFPNDARMQKRAQQIISAKRKAFKYPNLSTMFKAYEINID